MFAIGFDLLNLTNYTNFTVAVVHTAHMPMFTLHVCICAKNPFFAIICNNFANNRSLLSYRSMRLLYEELEIKHAIYVTDKQTI